jgi:hypothetical protein
LSWNRKTKLTFFIWTKTEESVVLEKNKTMVFTCYYFLDLTVYMGKRNCALDLKWEVSKGMEFVFFEDWFCLRYSWEKTSVVIYELYWLKIKWCIKIRTFLIVNLLEERICYNIGNKRKNNKICVNKLSLDENNIIYMYYIDDNSIKVIYKVININKYNLFIY